MIWKFVAWNIMVYGKPEAGGKCLICDQDAAEIIERSLFEFRLYCSSAIDDKPRWCGDNPSLNYSAGTNSFRNFPILLALTNIIGT